MRLTTPSVPLIGCRCKEGRQTYLSLAFQCGARVLISTETFVRPGLRPPIFTKRFNSNPHRISTTNLTCFSTILIRRFNCTPAPDIQPNFQMLSPYSSTFPTAPRHPILIKMSICTLILVDFPQVVPSSSNTHQHFQVPPHPILVTTQTILLSWVA